MSQIQSVLFDKNYWTLDEAKRWLRDNNLKPLKKEHTTKRFYRYRIRNPHEFSRIRTIKTHDGLDLLIGFY